MTLEINEINQNIQTIVDTLKLKFQNKIMSKKKNFIWLAIYRLIYLEKANLIWYKTIKKNIKTKNTEVFIKKK